MALPSGTVVQEPPSFGQRTCLTKTCPSGWKHQQRRIWHPGARESPSALDHITSCWSCHGLCRLIHRRNPCDCQGCYLTFKKKTKPKQNLKQVCAFPGSPWADCLVHPWKCWTWGLTRTKWQASQHHSGPQRSWGIFLGDTSESCVHFCAGSLPCAAHLREISPRGFRAAVSAVKPEAVAEQFTFRDICFSVGMLCSFGENNIPGANFACEVQIDKFLVLHTQVILLKYIAELVPIKSITSLISSCYISPLSRV